MPRVHVVADVHGNAEALARAGEGADALLVLGDLVDFVDYHDHSQGILGTLFGVDNVATFAGLRRAGARQEMAEFAKNLWDSLSDPSAAVDEAVRKQYATLFAGMTAPTYVIPGNVDVPRLMPEFSTAGIYLPDGGTVTIGGLRFGFVGGSLLPEGASVRADAAWQPHMRTPADFAAAVAGLDTVDVLCSHIPPEVPELVYDVVARNAELGSRALRARILADQPRWSLFGHVHQPLAGRARIDRTECRNVGHFKETARPYVLRW